MKFLVDFNRPHYLTGVLPLSLPIVLMHSGDKSAFTTYMGSNRGGRGGRGSGGRGRGRCDPGGRDSEQGGRGRGCGLHKCTYCHGEDHTVDFCWELYGKPLAHHASFKVEELPLQSLPPTSKVVSIPEEEYNRLLSLHFNSVGSDSTTTLAQKVLPLLVLPLRTLGSLT